jgi:hypothetical protein
METLTWRQGLLKYPPFIAVSWPSMSRHAAVCGDKA